MLYCKRCTCEFQVLRSLIQHSQSDGEKLRWFSEANQVLLGLHKDAFPGLEVDWFVSSCWNQGCHHAKFERQDAAEKFLALAIDLLRHSQTLQQRKEMMQKELERIREKTECGRPEL